jgi:hypothetical protein
MLVEFEAVLTRREHLATAGEMVLETAVTGRADRLVSFNVRHLRDAAARFGIVTVTPEAWKELCGP